MKIIACILLCLLSITSCSVFMAASGSEAPELHRIGAGSTRSEVEAVLGKPFTVMRKTDGDEAVYQFFTNDKASYGRAALYLGLDVVTAGLAEFATSPIEALQGNRHTVTILYGRDGRVHFMEHRMMDAPLPDPDDTVGGVFESEPGAAE